MSNNLFLKKLPDFKSVLSKNSDSNYTLTIDPLSPGYGHTIGNSLRRVMLTSIPGYAVTKVRINDLTHEYQAVEGVVEDVIEIVLNIKALRPQIITTEEKVTLSLLKSIEGPVTAADFKPSANAMIVNQDAYICHLNKGSEINIEIEICTGVGYTSMDDINLSDNKDTRMILVDSVFTPVTNVSMNVDKIRVGDKTNFDKLSINFDIDKSVSAHDVINYTFEIFDNIISKSKSNLVLDYGESKVKAVKKLDTKVTKVIVDSNTGNIDLPEKIKSILEKNNIRTNEDLAKNILEVADFAGIGAKALETIKDYLSNIKN
jgi:DNA-directed RNA polymerase subunit alpha